MRKAGLCLLLSTLVCGVALSDSIVVDGKVYENVIVREGTAFYYIQNPADGSLQRVSRDDIDPAQVTFSRSRAERTKLVRAWNEKNPRPRGVDTRVLRETAPGAQIVRRDGVIEITRRHLTAPLLTNRPGAGGDHGGRAFVRDNGSLILTNLPERFKDDSYQEVIFTYERIRVPKHFVRPTGAKGPSPTDLDAIVRHYAREYSIDPYLIYAVIRVESNGNRFAVSRAGAQGLMQLMPGTARDMGVDEIFDAAQNIAGGVQYLAKMIELFDGDKTLAIAGYNAGPGNVLKYKRQIPPFAETQKYVREVQRLQRLYRRHGPPNFKV